MTSTLRPTSNQNRFQPPFLTNTERRAAHGTTNQQPYSSCNSHHITLKNPFGYLAFPPGAVRTPPVVYAAVKSIGTVQLHANGIQQQLNGSLAEDSPGFPGSLFGLFPFEAVLMSHKAVSKTSFPWRDRFAFGNGRRWRTVETLTTHSRCVLSYRRINTFQATSVWLLSQMSANMRLVTSCLDRGCSYDEGQARPLTGAQL